MSATPGAASTSGKPPRNKVMVGASSTEKGRSENTAARPAMDSVTGFAFTDRGLYKPGEKAHVKGWFRRTRFTTDASVTPLGEARTMTWKAYDAFGNEMGKGEAELNDVSGFSFTIAVC